MVSFAKNSGLFVVEAKNQHISFFRMDAIMLRIPTACIGIQGLAPEDLGTHVALGWIGLQLPCTLELIEHKFSRLSGYTLSSKSPKHKKVA